jgi:flavocytochrome c
MLEKDKKFSRRNFLKGAAVSTAAVTGVSLLSSCGSNASASGSGIPAAWNYETDVVIVGAGGAGLAAAIKAGEASAKVIVLESMATVGGDTGISGQYMLAPDTEQNAQYGIQDSADAYFNDLLKSVPWAPKTGGPGDTTLVRAFVDNCTDVITWVKSLGVGFGDPSVGYMTFPYVFWHTAPRAYGGDGKLISSLNAEAVRQGAQLMTETEAEGLIQDSAGRVIGVKASGLDGKAIYLKAAKAVILATGSFLSSKLLRSRYLTMATNLLNPNVPGNMGGGQMMAQAINARLSDMDLGAWWYPFEDKTKASLAGLDAVGILVNKEGKRFMNELEGYGVVGREVAKQTHQVGYFIFDENSPFKPDVSVKTDTLEELALRINVAPAALQETIATYNTYVDNGSDPDFGRQTAFARIETGPFYAGEVNPQPYVSYGGVDINDKTQVLDNNGNVIPGLYAAGLVCGSVFTKAGLAYDGGVTQAVVFGRMAGTNAAAETSQA